MGIEYLVIVYLTFWDGSVAAHNDGKWETVVGEKACLLRAEEITNEMRAQFKDHDPKPNTFMKGCVQKPKEE